MQAPYFEQLEADVRSFVLDVEAASGVAIEVKSDESLNEGGPFGAGKLKVDIEPSRVILSAPTNGYFPDGAVLHEALHVDRILVRRVPRLAFNDDVDDWRPEIENAFVHLDNALEHLVIVPRELAQRPQRAEHWNAVMKRVWGTDLPAMKADSSAQRTWANVHWAFVRLVLADGELEVHARQLLATLQLLGEAEDFVNELQHMLHDKPLAMRMLFERFQLPRNLAALEYLDSGTGATSQVPV